jgi:putative FmdB family regulatory protein
MPIYNYKCKKCDREVVVKHKMSDESPKQCNEVEPKTECDGELEKVMRSGSFSLKGAGWFKDGY